MKNFLLLALSTLTAVSCGRGDDNADPPPVRSGDATGNVFALESGNYFVERLWNLNDGCKSRPLDPQDPITSVNFALTNDGKGKVTLERCVYEGRMAEGDIVGNRGTLSVSHSPRRREVGTAVAEYQQECVLEVTVVDNNTMDIQFYERQSGRNSTMRLASEVDEAECTTGYSMRMRKR